jgi:hypothetical protein
MSDEFNDLGMTLGVRDAYKLFFAERPELRAGYCVTRADGERAVHGPTLVEFFNFLIARELCDVSKLAPLRDRLRRAIADRRRRAAEEN